MTYWIKEKIDRGLDLGKLHKDIQQDITDIRLVSDDFSQATELATELDGELKRLYAKEIEAAIPKRETCKEEKKIGQAKKKTATDETEAEEIYFMPKSVQRFMPPYQVAMIGKKSGQKIAVGEEHIDTVKRLEKEIRAIPKMYKQDGKGMEAVVHAHFFFGGSDWFVTEYDGSDELFGYTVLNGDVEMSELGAFDLKSIHETGRIELDFFWKKKTLGKALHEKYPDDFPAGEEEKTTENEPQIQEKSISAEEKKEKKTEEKPEKANRNTNEETTVSYSWKSLPAVMKVPEPAKNITAEKKLGFGHDYQLRGRMELHFPLLEKLLKPFVSDDGLRQIMTGVHFEKTGIVASDSHSLVHLRAEIPLDKNGKTYGLSGKEINGEYPNWHRIVPQSAESVTEMDIHTLKTYLEAALPFTVNGFTVLKSKATGKNGFDAKRLITALEFFQHIGTRRLYAYLPPKNSVALILSDQKIETENIAVEKLGNFLLVMPMKGEGIGGEAYGAHSPETGSLSSYYDFDKAAIMPENAKVGADDTAEGQGSFDANRLATLLKSMRLVKRSFSAKSAGHGQAKVENGTLFTGDFDIQLKIEKTGIQGDGLYRAGDEAILRYDLDTERFFRPEIRNKKKVATLNAEKFAADVQKALKLTGAGDNHKLDQGLYLDSEKGKDIQLLSYDGLRVRVGKQRTKKNDSEQDFFIHEEQLRLLSYYVKFLEGEIKLSDSKEFILFESENATITVRKGEMQKDFADRLASLSQGKFKEIENWRLADPKAIKKLLPTKDAKNQYVQFDGSVSGKITLNIGRENEIKKTVGEIKTGTVNAPKGDFALIQCQLDFSTGKDQKAYGVRADFLKDVLQTVHGKEVVLGFRADSAFLFVAEFQETDPDKPKTSAGEKKKEGNRKTANPNRSKIRTQTASSPQTGTKPATPKAKAKTIAKKTKAVDPKPESTPETLNAAQKARDAFLEKLDSLHKAWVEYEAVYGQVQQHLKGKIPKEKEAETAEKLKAVDEKIEAAKKEFKLTESDLLAQQKVYEKAGGKKKLAEKKQFEKLQMELKRVNDKINRLETQRAQRRASATKKFGRQLKILGDSQPEMHPNHRHNRAMASLVNAELRKGRESKLFAEYRQKRNLYFRLYRNLPSEHARALARIKGAQRKFTQYLGKLGELVGKPANEKYENAFDGITERFAAIGLLLEDKRLADTIKNVKKPDIKALQEELARLEKLDRKERRQRANQRLSAWALSQKIAR